MEETRERSGCGVLELQAAALWKMYLDGEVEPRNVRIKDWYTGRTYHKVIYHSIK